MIAIAICSLTLSNIWYVDDDATGPGSGTFDDPFPTIQQGINAAESGDTVLIRDGTYKSNGNRNLFVDGKAITLRSEHDSTQCVIDAEGFSTIFNIKDVTGGTLTIQGITMTHGVSIRGGALYAEDSNVSLAGVRCISNAAGYDGGAAYFENCNVSLTDTTCDSNRTISQSASGGAVYAWNSKLRVEQCAFTNNLARGYGGALGAESCDVAMSDSTFSSNGSPFKGAYYGGAVSIYPGHADIKRCTFENGWAYEVGGGLFLYDDSPASFPPSRVIDCKFSHNQADTGGGLQLLSLRAIVKGCEFTDNVSAGYSGSGGGLYASGNITINGCVMARNTAQGEEGLGSAMVLALYGTIRVSDCVATNNRGNSTIAVQSFGAADKAYISNCIFSANSSPVCVAGYAPTLLINCLLDHTVPRRNGGSVVNASSAQVELDNCTVTGRPDSGIGSGRYGVGACSASQGGTLLIRNSILWFFGDYQIRLNSGSDHADVRYSCIKGGYAGTGNISADPQFAGVGDYRLSQFSPCCDAGDNTSVPSDSCDLDNDGDFQEQVPFDLEGNARFFDNPFVSDTGFGTPPVVDMGCFEWNSQSAPNFWFQEGPILRRGWGY